MECLEQAVAAGKRVIAPGKSRGGELWAVMKGRLQLVLPRLISNPKNILLCFAGGNCIFPTEPINSG